MNNLAQKQSDYIEKILQKTQFSGDVNAFKKSCQQAQNELEGTAGWHNWNQIETLKGLQGSFLWTENLFSPATIEFTFNAGEEGSAGQYAIKNLDGTTKEQGSFVSVPNNPAIGWAFIGLIPSDGSPSRYFTVAGMMTDASWEIQILLLNKTNAQGPINPPFSCIRV